MAKRRPTSTRSPRRKQKSSGGKWLLLVLFIIGAYFLFSVFQKQGILDFSALKPESAAIDSSLAEKPLQEPKPRPVQKKKASGTKKQTGKAPDRKSITKSETGRESRLEHKEEKPPEKQPAKTAPEKPQPVAAAESKPDTLKIATFNIQVFGQSKISKPSVMSKITDIIRKFDIVAIQEIRSHEEVMPKLVSMLGREWDYKVSARLGRTQSKEQYAFVFRKHKAEVKSVYTANDPDDYLHREPFIGRFKSGNFDFTLINIHTDPDEVDLEINHLDDIFRQELRNERDVLLLGDLNASPREFGELKKIPGMGWAVTEANTNVRETKTYDNIVFVKSNVREYLKGAVFNFKRYYGLELFDALDISDHFPVYAYFLTNLKDDD